MTTNVQKTESPDALAGYVFSDQVGHLLRRAYQLHFSIFQEVIPDTQLTAAQFVCLCAVQEHGPSSLNDVVRITAIDQGTTRGIIERLKSRGLVDVSHDPDDKRKVLIRQTDAGERLVREMVPFAKLISERTMDGLNPAERFAIIFLLRKMANSFDAKI